MDTMTKMKINGIPFGTEYVPDYSMIYISLFLGVILFIILSEISAISFKKQVK